MDDGEYSTDLQILLEKLKKGHGWKKGVSGLRPPERAIFMEAVEEKLKTSHKEFNDLIQKGLDKKID